MQQQAQATLGGVLTAHNRHEEGGFAALFAHDGVVRTVPTGEAAHGREDIAAFLEAHFQSFPDSQIARRGVSACADCTWVEWTITGTHAGEFMGHPASHRGFELHGCSRFTFTRDGLLAEDALYFDPATILRQLGLTRDDLRAA